MKTKAITKAAGAVSNDPTEAKRRLSNIRPREVSLVDSAANGRQFLIVKRSGDMKKKDKTLFKGAEGTTEDPSKTKEADPAAAPAAKEGEPAAPEAVVEKGEFQLVAEKTLEGIPVVKALAMEQKGMFMAMSDALMSIAMSLDFIRMDLMSFNNSDGKTGFMGEEVVKALKAENPEASEAELVEKAGRKMKKDRLSKLKGIVGSLESLIKELDDEQVQKGGNVDKKNEEKKDQETQKSTEGAPAATATPEKKEGEAAPAAAAASSGLTIEDVQKAVSAAVEPLKKEIETLKNAPAAPAGEGAESTEDMATNKSKGGKQESIFKGVIR